jgi:hypothetical protein
MGQGPLSNPELVRAIAETTPVQVNVKADGKNVCGTNDIAKPCNFVFADVAGKKIETYEGEKEARPMAQRIYEIAKKYPRDLPWETSLEAALERAAKEERRVALMFVGKTPAQVPLLLDDALEDLRGKFLFVKVVYDKKSPEVEKYAVKAADTMVILDAEGAEKARIAGKKPVKTLKKELEAALSRKP